MDEIRNWLQEHGLGDFSDAFAREQIQVADLPDLTDDDLRELGLPMGPRKRLLRAAAEINRTSPATDGVTVSDVPSVDDVERRQLTVVFCDLVGSVELGEKMDVEEYRDLIAQFRIAVVGGIEQHAGFIARHQGDGVLAYFGYPQAQEDDAERAVRAGLAVVRAVRNLDRRNDAELAVRVGIATGPAVVGDMLPSGASERSELAALGATPNLAARLQAYAKEGAVVVSEATGRLVDGLFVLEPLAGVALKGIAEPVTAYRALDATHAESRSEALEGARLSALVGRRGEIGLVLDRWESAKLGSGQAVLVSAEPGVGKSRLVHEVRVALAAERHRIASLYCSPHRTGTALYPISAALLRELHFGHEAETSARLDRLKAWLDELGLAPTEHVPLLAPLLSIPLDDGDSPRWPRPEDQRERLLGTLVSIVEAIAAKAPLLLVAEDLHWIDPTSLELLHRLLHTVRTARVLAVLTFRPEFESPWASQPHLTNLTLNHLTEQECRQLANEITSERGLSEDVVTDIVARTDGVPLFVEEVARAMLESAEDETTEQRVPVTLRDALTARLDRLGAAKSVAQTAAVIGRQFRVTWLEAMVEHREAEVGAALDRLVATGLLHRPDASTATYSFKHALVRDAAYASLLSPRRRELHARLARFLAATGPGEEGPELLAHHFSEAGIADEAVRYGRLAARRAAEQSADAEALIHARRALNQLDEMAPGQDRDELELDLLVELVPATISSVGHAAPGLEDAFERAIALSARVGEIRKLFPILYAQQVFLFVSGPLPKLRDFCHGLLERVARHHDDVIMLNIERTFGTVATMAGDPIAALEHSQRALELYHPQEHGSMAFVYGQDGRVATLTWMLFPQWYAGFPDQARETAAHALAGARELDHANTLAQTLAFAATMLPGLIRDTVAAREGLEALKVHLDAHPIPFWETSATALEGRQHHFEGRPQQAVAALEQAIADTRAQAVTAWRATYQVWLAEAFAAQDRHSEALRILDEALVTMNERGEHWYEAELHRIRGEVLHATRGGPHEAAESSFRRAIETARQYAAKTLELRATVSLATQLRERGEPQTAYELLSPLYAWFTEGHDTPDLQEAKGLLEALA